MNGLMNRAFCSDTRAHPVPFESKHVPLEEPMEMLHQLANEHNSTKSTFKQVFFVPALVAITKVE